MRDPNFGQYLLNQRDKQTAKRTHIHTSVVSITESRHTITAVFLYRRLDRMKPLPFAILSALKKTEKCFL